jgi:ADP-ribose pyrophosphatase YjhB (NUDIX family)
MVVAGRRRHGLEQRVPDPRTYPERPYLAVSAAIFRNGKVLLAKRARPPVTNVYTLPGGGVEVGETLTEAVVREVLEETAMQVEPIALAGYRNVVIRDADGRVQRHFVVLPFASRWIAGEFTQSDELADGRWFDPREVAGLQTTEGLADIIAAAFALAHRPTAAASVP